MAKISPKYFYRPLSAGQSGNSQSDTYSSTTLPRLSVCSSSSSSGSPHCTTLSATNHVATTMIKSTSSTTSPLFARSRPVFHSFGVPQQQHQKQPPCGLCPCSGIPPSQSRTSNTNMSFHVNPQPAANLMLAMMPPNLYNGGSSASYMTNTSTVPDGHGPSYAPPFQALPSDGGYGGTETSVYYEQLDDRWPQPPISNKTYNTLLPRPMPVRHNNPASNRQKANWKAVFTLAVVGSLLVSWLLYLLLCTAFGWPLFTLSAMHLTDKLATTTEKPVLPTITNISSVNDDDFAQTAQLNAQLSDDESREVVLTQLSTTSFPTTTTTAATSAKPNAFVPAASIAAPLPTALKLERRLPQAIIIGVKKGGTRALLAYLRMHSKVRTAGPEPHFFDRHYDRGAEWYRNQMPLSTSDEITIEKTPSYFVTASAAERVYKLNPRTKIIIVLREPVERAESDYAQSYAKNRTTRSFEQMALRLPPPYNSDHPHHHQSSATVQRAYRKARVNTDWNAIKLGIYVNYVRTWLKWFPRQQIHIVSGEGLIYQPAQEIEMVQTFLGLPVEITAKNFYFNTTKGFPCIIRPVKPDHEDDEMESNTEESAVEPHCLGNTKGREHPHVHPVVLQKLRSFYAPYNDELTRLTGFHHNW